MNALIRLSLAAIPLATSSMTAFASQGPGASPGTATPLQQALLIGAILLACCVGLAARFIRH